MAMLVMTRGYIGYINNRSGGTTNHQPVLDFNRQPWGLCQQEREMSTMKASE
jgi:hypothetical protein